MTKRIAIVAATGKEAQPLLDFLKVEATQQAFQSFKLHSLTIDIIFSGIGILQTTYALMDYLSHHHPDAWIQVGIGGAFDPSLSIGDVYLIESEVLVEFGAEDRDGRIIDQFELEWMDSDRFPYEDGRLHCPHISDKIPIVTASGMTCIHSHGYAPHIEQLRKNVHGQIENMEGASFFYISLMKKIPFLSIRSISNYVEERDTKKWNFDLAIKNLNKVILELIKNGIITLVHN